jgi:hypothetical protein
LLYDPPVASRRLGDFFAALRMTHPQPGFL